MLGDVMLEDLDVVGTTSGIEDLPKRLCPVYRERGGEGLYYFTVAEDGLARPMLSLEPRECFEAMVASGEALCFDTPIPARAGFLLMQIERGAPPEYVPADGIAERLFRACREALERASRALSEGKREEAESFIWYARRADSDDPLPLLALMALLRDDLDPEELRFLELDLAAYPHLLVEAARRRAHDRAELASLGELLDVPPRSGTRLMYLADYPAHPSFLSKARALVRTPSRRRG